MSSMGRSIRLVRGGHRHNWGSLVIKARCRGASPLVSGCPVGERMHACLCSPTGQLSPSASGLDGADSAAAAEARVLTDRGQPTRHQAHQQLRAHHPRRVGVAAPAAQPPAEESSAPVEHVRVPEVVDHHVGGVRRRAGELLMVHRDRRAWPTVPGSDDQRRAGESGRMARAGRAVGPAGVPIDRVHQADPGGTLAPASLRPATPPDRRGSDPPGRPGPATHLPDRRPLAPPTGWTPSPGARRPRAGTTRGPARSLRRRPPVRGVGDRPRAQS